MLESDPDAKAMLMEYNNLPMPNQTSPARKSDNSSGTSSGPTPSRQAPCPRAEAAIETRPTEIASGRANEINRFDWAQSAGEPWRRPALDQGPIGRPHDVV
jgi:hypothetical protein